jgi:protein O-mannosyl-transferase
MNPTLFRSRGVRTAASAAVLVAAAVLAYWPALSGGFVWDDDTLLTESALVKAADGLHRIWFTTEPLDYWPLTNTSFWLEWRLWGMHAAGYHVTNLLLHVGSALLLWAILRRLAIPGAFLAALLFVVHPVNVESVAWIAQRKNTLSMVFFLLSILWFVRSELDSPPVARQTQPSAGRSRSRAATRRASASSPENSSKLRSSREGAGGPGRAWYWLSLGAFVLAMLSKGSVAILPGILLLLIWWRRGIVTRANVMRTAPFFAVAAVLTVVNIWFQGHLATGPIRHASLVERTLGAAAIVWFYLYKAVLPIRLLFVYPQWHVQATLVRWWFPLAAAVAVSAVLLRKRHDSTARALLFAWVFFCLALFPVMGFTDVYYMTYSMVADHYEYIAIVGVVTAAAAGLSQLAELAREPNRADDNVPGATIANAGKKAGLRHAAGAPLWSGALVVLLGTATWRQSHEYVNAETLYRETLKGNPSTWLMHNLLGLELLDSSMNDAAAHFREAARLAPGTAGGPVR